MNGRMVARRCCRRGFCGVLELDDPLKSSRPSPQASTARKPRWWGAAVMTWLALLWWGLVLWYDAGVLSSISWQQEQEQQQQQKQQGQKPPPVQLGSPRQKPSGQVVNGCEIPPGYKVVMTHDRSGRELFSMVVFDYPDWISDKIKEQGFWEVDSLSEIADLGPTLPSDAAAPGTHLLPSPEEGIFLDVGANLGFYTLLFASQGYQVVAVEPSPYCAKALRASLCLHPTWKASLWERGLSDRSATCRLSARPDLLRLPHMVTHAMADITCPASAANDQLPPCDRKDLLCQPVQVSTLDQLLNEEGSLSGARVAVMKMDVEGHEMHVLRGAHTLLNDPQRRPVWFQYECKNEAQRELGRTLCQTYGYLAGNKRGHDGNAMLRHNETRA